MPNKLVYIAGLPHSGSTLLSLLLGKHPSMVALGEVNLQLRRMRREKERLSSQICGCGVPVPECALWGRVLKELPPSADEGKDYDLVWRVFCQLYGPGIHPVDASKIKEPLLTLARTGGREVRVIHLTRDYRSAVTSDVIRQLKEQHRWRPRWLLSMEKARRWLRENRKLDRAIEETGFPALRLGYEELLFSPERSWNSLWKFLEVPPGNFAHDTAGSRNHIFIGNRMRSESHKIDISYDTSWFTSEDWLLSMLLIPGVLEGNRRWVYSNGVFGPWVR